MKKHLVTFSASVFCIIMMGALPGSSSRPARADDSAPSDPIARGRTLFEGQCAICHGEAGDGQGKFAYLMNPRPRNFLTGKFKLATTENMIPSDADLLDTLRRGMPGSAMPPWDHLPTADLSALIGYVRHLRLEAVREEIAADVAEGVFTEAEAAEVVAEMVDPGPALSIPPEPPFDDLRWFRGRRIYLQACASCHGADGHPVAEAVKFDDEGYPDPPRSFVNGIFKGGIAGHKLYARILKGMKGTPMPGFEGSYSDAETWDLIHYIQTLAREGAQERAQLRRTTIVAARVPGDLPPGPTDASWDQARPAYVGLTPLWWAEDRIEGLVVQALHNEREVAIRLSWIDPTIDDQALRHEQFRDGVAIQFSLSSNPPFYMGSPGAGGGVNMWFWKADRQTNITEGYQDVDTAFPDRAVDMYPEQAYKAQGRPQGEDWPTQEIRKHIPEFITAWGAGNLVADPTLKTPVESLVAHGPGTLAGMPANLQMVQGSAAYDRGVWTVQMHRSLTVGDESGESDERSFQSGDYIPVSFAIWNGDVRDRDGKKNISIWQRLVIE